jgi:glutathione S-transferase
MFMLRSILRFRVLAKAPTNAEEGGVTSRVLYGHYESGHSYKVALALNLLGLPYEYREVAVFSPREARREDWQAVTRYGEIPVLVTGGKALSQSDAILLSLARATGRLDGGDIDQAAQWLFWEANRIGISLPNYRLYRRWEAGDPGLLAWLRARLEADMGRLEQELHERPFLMGEEVSIADCACCGYAWFFDQTGLDIGAWPHVKAWLGRLAALPGWKHPYELLREEPA